MHPRIEVSGGPRERGRQYGTAAADRVRRSVEAYGEVFEHWAGWQWDRVRVEAERFGPVIESYGRSYLEEIEGIADGAGLDTIDILAINVRTEIMFAATARDAEARRRLPAECSAFAALGARTGDGRLLLGQNWDWLPHTQETTVILEARQDDGPDFVTVVEAGLLAKFGLNSSGIALATNALVTDRDLGDPGVPFHVLLRAILDAETLSDALVALQRAERASSANYLIAHEDGIALDVEAAPGDFSELYLAYPENGVLLHTNHFINGLRGRDVSVYAMPDSPVRLARLRQLVDARADAPLDVAFWQETLADHATFPLGVCCHPDPRLPVPERSLTVAAVVMDPARRTLWLASGSPCTDPFEELDYSAFLTKPSALRDAAASAP
jgi:isopenicillin-N N-acyltransferase like protein